MCWALNFSVHVGDEIRYNLFDANSNIHQEMFRNLHYIWFEKYRNENCKNFSWSFPRWNCKKFHFILCTSHSEIVFYASSCRNFRVFLLPINDFFPSNYCETQSNNPDIFIDSFYQVALFSWFIELLSTELHENFHIKNVQGTLRKPSNQYSSHLSVFQSSEFTKSFLMSTP